MQAERTVPLIRERLASNEPVFIYVPFPAPHGPWSVSDDFDNAASYLYGRYLAQSDHYAGVILDALADPDRNPSTDDSITDNRIVFMSSDNGPEAIAQETSLAVGRDSNGPVSYTHLTLPTKA